MGPHVRLTAAVLVPLLGFGCVGQRREVRLHADGAPQVAHVPESGGQAIEIPEAELWGAFREAGRHVVARTDPLAAAQETFGLAERSGTYLYYARTGRLVAESLDDGLVEVEGSDEAVTRGYLEWCGGTKLGPGDCLRLLSHSKVLTPHRRYVVALVMAMALSFGPMFDSLEGLADPNKVAVTLASAASMYLLLLVVPEPLSKAIAIGLTVTLIGYIGLDLFWSLVNGWKALVSAVDQARNFSDMWLAARDFGQVLGPQMGQLLLLLVSRSLGKGIAAPGKPLPRFSEASAQAEKLLRVRLAAATAVRTVTLGAGVITISLASSAVAVTSPSPVGRGGPAPAAKGDTSELSKEVAEELGKLRSVGEGAWESRAGLIYRQGSKHGNRVLHVLEHAAPDGSKLKHSVFVGGRKNVLSLIDEAWSARRAGVVQGDGNTLYHVPMGRQVGTAGETSIDIVIKKGTASEVVTAFPTF